MSRPLSRCQRELLDFIRDYFCGHYGMAPTIRECADHFGKCDSTIFSHLAALMKKNYISRSSRARSIVLKEPGFRGRLCKIPLWETVDGAGDFQSQKAENTLMMTIPARTPRCFAIRVGDDALQTLGIREGDIAVAAWRAVPAPGDLVVVAPGGAPFVVRFLPGMTMRTLGVVIAVERFYR